MGGTSNTNIHITPSNEMMEERPLPRLLGNIFEILHACDGGAINQHPLSPHHDSQSETRSVKSSFLGCPPHPSRQLPTPPLPRTVTHSYALGLPFNTMPMLHSRPTTRKSHAISITKYSIGMNNKCILIKVCFKLNYKVNPCILYI